ncbi:MAG TPA: cobalt transporter CbiM [Anaeromyxobacteraceae bacterium]|nr:cobalt transporter CbiM [Anaeromyxobacteraceae bacterium]
MHIPDNYLSPSTCAVLGGAMFPVWTTSIRKVRAQVPRTKVPLLGVAAAFSFLIMMFNVPLPGGTTGHAVGAVLIAALLGPWAACISVSVALLVQALLFGDGGILAFGANSFNMAFVIPFAGYFLFDVLRRRLPRRKGELAALAVGAYLGLNLAALCAAIEFGLQPLIARDAAGLPLYCPYPLSVSVPAMTIPHLLVAGVVEVVFTLGIYAFVRRVSPGVVQEGAPTRMCPLYVSLGLLALLSPLGLLAAGTAWGEWGPDEIKGVVSGGKALGYVPAGMEKGWSLRVLFPDYGVSGFPEWFGYILSAVVAVAILVIVFKLLGLARKDPRPVH